jgi:hypothetical protein
MRKKETNVQPADRKKKTEIAHTQPGLFLLWF